MASDTTIIYPNGTESGESANRKSSPTSSSLSDFLIDEASSYPKPSIGEDRILGKKRLWNGTKFGPWINIMASGEKDTIMHNNTSQLY
jgi:hypothetical protein